MAKHGLKAITIHVLTVLLAMGLLAQALPIAEAPYHPDHVVINEFEQNPPGDERYVGGEFIELFNPTPSPVDVSGWVLRTTHGRICTYIISQGTVIPSAGFWLAVLRGQCIDNSNPDSVVLLDGAGRTVDQTPAKTDTANDERSWQRMPDGHSTNWVFKSATRGYQNDPNTIPIPEFKTASLALIAALAAPAALLSVQRLDYRKGQEVFGKE